jgi:putative membrane protein
MLVLPKQRGKMSLITKIFIGFIMAEHLYILWLEMFMWTKPLGKKVFSGFPSELFEKTKSLAANQGLYNGFLSAGLLWSLFIQDPIWSKNVAIFFTSCVAIAGIYGAATAMKKIFYTQALPALVALGLLILL